VIDFIVHATILRNSLLKKWPKVTKHYQQYATSYTYTANSISIRLVSSGKGQHYYFF